MDQKRYFHREVSWLAFNHRVLQEAMDPSVPLFERIKFLAIFSSNLDEFFRVRVASIKSYKELDSATQKAAGLSGGKILKQIRLITHQQQEEFGRVFRDEIVPSLAGIGIDLVESDQFSREEIKFAQHFFEEHVKEHIETSACNILEDPPFLQNRELYFAVKFHNSNNAFGIVNIPSYKVGNRFVELPVVNGRHRITWLDEVIRVCLQRYFPDVERAYAIKLSRDADLKIEDEFSGNLLEQIREALKERNIGLPTRLLYDSAIPDDFLLTLKAHFDLSKNELIPGSRHHNFNDFFHFPNPTDREDVIYEELDPVPVDAFEHAESLIEVVQDRDVAMHFPYQQFKYIPALIEEAAVHPDVERIQISLYRVAKDSSIVHGLLRALENGKEVFAFLEVKARFDEAHNMQWGETLSSAGARVVYSYPGIKVHSKIFRIAFRPEASQQDIAFLSTGNFNEKTARLYCDSALLTSDPRIADEVGQVFKLLDRELLVPNAKHLLIAPYNMKSAILKKIDREIAIAREGGEGYLIFKLNNLEDREVIDKLYEASEAGVKVSMIVRSICCLRPGVSGLSERIHVISIVDRFLEHSRLYVFGNNGNEEMYFGSADLMTRNLDHRIEVLAPILDSQVYEEFRELLTLQLQDHTKARWINALLSNPYRRPIPGKPNTRAQRDIYTFLKERYEEVNEGTSANKETLD